jgi:hypothetical protein
VSAIELAVLLFGLAAAWLWSDSLGVRERAIQAGRDACRRYGVQLLDETVAIARLWPARNTDGRLRLRRTYTFEFSDTGNNRRHGAIVMLGRQVEDLQLEPYPLQ